MHKRLLSTVLLLLTTFNCSAGVWEEREYLERYIEQIEALNETLLVSAQQAANPDSRIQLDYEKVIQTNEEMINKLKQYLYSPMEPYRPNGIALSQQNNSVTEVQQ